MRTFSTLIVLFFCGQAVATAQVNPALKSNELKIREDLRLKPELNFNGEAQLVSNTAPRVVQVIVRNTGAVNAGNFVLEVTYNWRVDHESFSAQNIKRAQTIYTLAAGQQTQVTFTLPDNLIRSNRPYGSANVNLSFKIDSTNTVAEMQEGNNNLSFSLPILNN